MRIIAGLHRGRRIAAPPGRTTRPMLDRVRESLFATLAPWLPDAVVLDLFAGSGALGLEALSRGARAVRFVEQGAAALTVLRANVAALEVGDSVEISRADAMAPASWQGGPRLGTDARYDIVFLDPPYAMVEDPRRRAHVLAAVSALSNERLTADGRLVLHVPRGLLDRAAFAEDLATTRREYGSNALWYVHP